MTVDCIMYWCLIVKFSGPLALVWLLPNGEADVKGQGLCSASAIDFFCTVDKIKGYKGEERVIVTFNGQFCFLFTEGWKRKSAVPRKSARSRNDPSPEVRSQLLSLSLATEPEKYPVQPSARSSFHARRSHLSARCHITS